MVSRRDVLCYCAAGPDHLLARVAETPRDALPPMTRHELERAIVGCMYASLLPPLFCGCFGAAEITEPELRDLAVAFQGGEFAHGLRPLAASCAEGIDPDRYHDYIDALRALR